MIYKGYKIERVIHPCDASQDDSPDGAQLRMASRRRVEYTVSEAVGGFHWQEIGSTNNRAMAKEMVDRVVTVRKALSRVIGVAV